MSAQLLSHVKLLEIPRTVAHQTPLFMEFSRQEILDWVAISSSTGHNHHHQKDLQK